MTLNNYSADSVNERIPGAEPVPKWPEAKETYQWAWELHYIGLTCAYLLVAVYSLIIALCLFIKRRTNSNKKSMVYYYAVHSLLMVFGITRALFLLTDPYELNLDFPLVSTRLLFGIGFPCLTSSYSLLHLSFLQISRVRLARNKLQNKSFVLTIIALHFILVLVADTTTALKQDTTILVLVCMSFYILWGSVISISILYSGIKILRKLREQTIQLRSISRGKNSGGIRNPSFTQLFFGNTRPDHSKKTARITLLTAVLAMSSCACNLYALVGVYRIYTGVLENSDPWQWWAFQTIFRLIEICLAFVMGYAVTPVNLWGQKTIQSRNASVMRNNSRSRVNTESAVFFNNPTTPSKLRNLSERTGDQTSRVRHASVKTDVNGKDLFDIPEEKLPNEELSETFPNSQIDEQSRLPKKLQNLLELQV